MSKTITHVKMNYNVWVSDKNGDPVPGIEFYFTKRTELCEEEIYIYYNMIDGTWFGESISYGEWFDLDDKTVQYYIDAYDLKGMVE